MEAAGDDQERQLLGDEAQSDGDHENIGVDEARVLEEFNHLYWTRLVSTTDNRPEVERKWPLGQDIVEECQAVANLDEAGQDRWVPLFEPVDFNRLNQPLTVEKYRLTEA